MNWPIYAYCHYIPITQITQYIKYPTMHHVVTEMCTFLLQHGALWDMGLVHCGICTTGLLHLHLFWDTSQLRMWIWYSVIISTRGQFYYRFSNLLQIWKKIILTRDKFHNNFFSLILQIKKKIIFLSSYFKSSDCYQILQPTRQIKENMKAPHYWLALCAGKMFPFDDIIMVGSYYSDLTLSQEFSQWQHSFQWKLHSHWLKFLRQRHGPQACGHKETKFLSNLNETNPSVDLPPCSNIPFKYSGIHTRLSSSLYTEKWLYAMHVWSMFSQIWRWSKHHKKCSLTLTYCGLVNQYGTIDLGQHLFVICSMPSYNLNQYWNTMYCQLGS